MTVSVIAGVTYPNCRRIVPVVVGTALLIECCKVQGHQQFVGDSDIRKEEAFAVFNHQRDLGNTPPKPDPFSRPVANESLGVLSP